MAVDTEYARWILLGTRGSLSYGVGPVTSGALNIDIIGCRPRRADAPEHELFCISGMPVGGGYSPLPFTIAESAAEENPGSSRTRSSATAIATCARSTSPGTEW